MSFFFGDGFDLYAQVTDCAGYWDASFGGSGVFVLSSIGRFAGSKGLMLAQPGGSTPYITKTSGQNDAVHHISVAFEQTGPLTGTSLGFYFTLYDGATAQCSVVFRQDGAILLTSGGSSGTVLATYAGAIAAVSSWYQFEIEVVINNTTGSIAVRKNGNTSNDFSLGSLNTRASANNYANKIGVGNNAWTNGAQVADDILWRSDATSGSGLATWFGDIRCFTRLPASDASVQFTRSGSIVPVTPYAQGGTQAMSNSGRYTPFIATCDGAIGSVVLPMATASTSNVKCSIFSNSAGNTAGAVLGSATPIASPVAGNNTFTFTTPVPVTRGTTYWLGFCTDTGTGTWNITTSFGPGAYSNQGGLSSGVTYAAFPTANPPFNQSGLQDVIFTANITPTTLSNAAFVAEPATDYGGTYDYSSTPGQSDLYAIAPIASNPSSTVGVTTRAYCEKSDAGTRNLAVQLKSFNATATQVRPYPSTTTGNKQASETAALPFTATATGSISIVTVSVASSATAHMKGAIYDASGTTLLGTSNEVTNPAAGNIALTFSPPVNVVSGTSYLFSIDQDNNIVFNVAAVSGGHWDWLTYASFPPSVAVNNFALSSQVDFTANITGSATVASPSTPLATSWNWIARNDLVDPASGAAWTAAAVNAAQIGPVVTA